MIFSKKEVYEIIVPLIMEQVFMAAIGMFDIIMVSGLGEAAISAVSLVDFINQLINSVLTAFSTGGAIVCSQYMGRKNIVNTDKAIQALVILVVFAGVILMGVTLTGNHMILKSLYGSIDKEVMLNAQIYFRLSGLAYPFLGLFCCSSAIMRALGYTRLSFHTSLAMNVLNIAMNAVFIFVFRWGVFGAGLASLLSRMIISLILFCAIFKGQNIIQVHPLHRWRLRRDSVCAILRLAIPTSMESSMFYIGRLLVQGIVTGFGTSSIAANAVSLNAAEFLHMPGGGIGIGMITIVGRCIGADEKEQAREYAVKLIRMAYIIQGICCVLSIFLVHWITGLYNLTYQTREIAEAMLISHGVICAIFWPMGFTTANALKSAGDVRFTMVMSFASMWIFRVGGSCFFIRLFPELGVLNVWIAMYVDWMVRAAVCFMRFRGEGWMEKKV